jgi:hypothetical protein
MMPEFDFDRAPSGASKQSKGGSFDFAEIPQVMIVDGGESGGEEGDDSALDTANRSLDMLEAAQSHKPGFFYDGIQEKEVSMNTDPDVLFLALFFRLVLRPPFHFFFWQTQIPRFQPSNSGEIWTGGEIVVRSAAAPK